MHRGFFQELEELEETAQEAATQQTMAFCVMISEIVEESMYASESAFLWLALTSMAACIRRRFALKPRTPYPLTPWR